MGFLTDRRGSFSWLRFSILIVVIGAVFLLFGFISFQLDQQSRLSPFYPDLAPNAQTWGGIESLGGTLQRVYYRVPGGVPADVADFYNKKMAEFYGTGNSNSTLEQCRRLPPTGEFTNIPDQQRPANDGLIFNSTFEPGKTLPYSYSCMFDRSGFNSVQTTLVSIQPGMPNTDPNLNSEGDTVIIYEQRWQR